MALDISQAIEAAERNARDLQAKQTPKPILALNQPTRRPYSQGRPKSSDNQTKCYRCGSSHQARECPFKDAECHYCKRKGHIAKVCRTKARDEGNKMAHKTYQVIEAIEDSHKEGLEDNSYSLYKMTSRKCDPIMKMVTANGVELKMEVDTGASVSIISEYTYKKLWTHNMPPLEETTLKMCTYTGETLQVHGAITVDVTYSDHPDTLALLVVEGTGPSLMGRDWLTKIRLDWENKCNIQANPTWLQKVLDKHKKKFQDGLGLVKNTTAKIHVDETAQPRFCRLRIVPYALRGKVTIEIDWLAKSGIIEPV